MRGRIVLLGIGAMLVAAASSTAKAPLVTPPCPHVEGWTPAGTFGPIDQGLGIQFQCNYAVAGQAEQLTLDVLWTKPSSRNVGVDYSQCGKASTGGPAERFIYSGKAVAREEYVVSGGPHNAGVFQADRTRIEVAALMLLNATAALAKPCARTTTPAPSSTARPTVQVEPARGRAGTVLLFSFTVGGPAGRVRIVLTIYRGANNATVLLRKDYGKATVSRPGQGFSVRIRANARATDLWCITATDAAGRTARGCSSFIVRYY
jgi:hypothetical protein